MSGRIYKVPAFGKWLSFTDADLKARIAAGQELAAQALKGRWDDYEQNHLAFFLPHGLPWCGRRRVFGDNALVVPPSSYPEAWRNDGVAFLNDWDSDLSMVLACNQSGKTLIGAAWSCLRILPCDPTWPIFTENGVVHHPWQGPKVWVISSY